MSKRKEYLKTMKYYLELYELDETDSINIEGSEAKLIREMLALQYLTSNAFTNLSSGNAGQNYYAYRGAYPFTPAGYEYFELGWYQVFKQSGKYQFIRDVCAFIGAGAGIAIGVIQLFNKI